MSWPSLHPVSSLGCSGCSRLLLKSYLCAIALRDSQQPVSHYCAVSEMVSCPELLPLQDGNVVHFKAKRGTQFRKLMKAYCERQSFQPESVVFMYDGERLRGDQTPADVSISWLSSLAVWPTQCHLCKGSETSVGQADAFKHDVNIVCALVQLAPWFGGTEADSRPAPSVAVC